MSGAQPSDKVIEGSFGNLFAVKKRVAECEHSHCREIWMGLEFNTEHYRIAGIPATPGTGSIEQHVDAGSNPR